MDLLMLSMSVAHRQQGFTFVEMAVVLALAGLMTWAVTSAYGNSTMVRDRQRATQTGEVLRETLRAFALTNGRLPCPDTDGDGWEDGAGSTCNTADQAGWLPYRSLQLEMPDARLRAAYAVYRRPASDPLADADLARRLERTGDAAAAPHYQDARDLIAALHNAMGDAPSSARTRLTGNGAGEGAIDCSANVRSHPAWLAVLPLEDSDGDGDRFDGPHRVGHACAVAPGTGLTHDADEVVVAEPLQALAGWLGSRAP